MKDIGDWLDGLPRWLAALLVVGALFAYTCLFPAWVEGL
jgi:hypothetical protein